MSGIVNNTADILAILGGVTTFFVGVFAAIRMSRCKKVACCWDGCVLLNEPPKDKNSGVAPPPNTPKRGPSDLASSDSELDLGMGVVV
jgi:hypothetical protein